MDLARICVWHVKQVSLARGVFNCATVHRGSWTLCQLVQASPRRSWTPPRKFAWRALSWHPRQVLLTPAASIFFKETIGPFSPFSVSSFMWVTTSPWQLAQTPGSFLWRVCSKIVSCFSWHVLQSLTSNTAAAAGGVWEATVSAEGGFASGAPPRAVDDHKTRKKPVA